MNNVLIIGATSAVASDIARRHAGNGDSLYLLARNEVKLQKLCCDLGSSVVGSYSVDFCQTDQAADWIAQANEVLGGIDVAWIAHGDLGDQILSEQSFPQALHTINVNYVSAVSLLIPLSELMKQRGRGKIAVLNSVAGDRGRPRNYTYGSAKAALHIYLQGLRSVCWGKGVEVYSFKLGPVISPMTVDHEKNFSFSTVEKVASVMFSALNKGGYTRYVPGYWFWVMLIVRCMPEFIFQRLAFLSGR